MTIEEERLTRLERLFDRFNISSTDGITVEGSLNDGYAIDTSAVRGRGGTGILGACCVGSNCFRTTESSCISFGGTYFGDGTLCVPNPCTSFETGACCFDDGTCSVETAVACASDGGTYQGDGTTCTPNPCECNCGFLHNGVLYRQYIETYTGKCDNAPCNESCPWWCGCIRTDYYIMDQDTCTVDHIIDFGTCTCEVTCFWDLTDQQWVDPCPT